MTGLRSIGAFCIVLTGAPVGFVLALGATSARAQTVSERALKVHHSGMLFDGHNDLPWRLRTIGDLSFAKFDLNRRQTTGQTDIPRLREGGVKAQFWSVYIPSEHENPARTVLEQIDLVHRMVERYPNDFALATTADEVEKAVKSGKIASLIGIEGGVAIENDLAMLRVYRALGVSYMTLTHNKTLDWADACIGPAKSDGLSPFGERVVKEMNRLGILVDISHVSPATMDDALRVSQAPVIASHSSAFAVAPSPRNVPDEILKKLKANGGVVMVNFYSGFVSPEGARMVNEARKKIEAENPEPKAFGKAFEAWFLKAKLPRGTIKDVADHIDHIVKIAGIDHVGIGSDFDGITQWPEGLEDVSSYPRLTEELLGRGYSDSDVHKILGENVLRAFREAGKASDRLKRRAKPEIDEPAKEKE